MLKLGILQVQSQFIGTLEGNFKVDDAEYNRVVE